MVRQDGAELKRIRMREIATKIIKQLNQVPSINLSEILPILEYETGLSHERLTEYLKVIAATGRFDLDIENGKITKIPASVEEAINE